MISPGAQNVKDMLITAKDGLKSHDMDTFAPIIKTCVYVLETSQEIYYTAYNH